MPTLLSGEMPATIIAEKKVAVKREQKGRMAHWYLKSKRLLRKVSKRPFLFMLFSTLPLYPHWGRKTVIVLLVTGKFLPVKASAASLTFGWDGNIPVEPNLPQVVGQAVYQVVKKV